MEQEDIMEVDNLYLDINGLVYKCVKDEGVAFKDFLKQKEFTEIWQLVVIQIDNIVQMINPRKILFLALDGVPPRAKTNQSR